MTLLNGLLALGALAFTIPLTIHLLFKSRFKTVQWGAMHLLDAVVRVNRRRMQWTEWLLLFVRCAIPILLALALARPVLTGFRALPGETAQTVVLAIDDSRSMAATDDAGTSAMQRATTAMTEYLGTLSRRDEVILVKSSQGPLPPSSMGRDEAMRQVAELQPRANAASLDRLVRSAVSALSNASHAQRRIVLVSDLRSGDVEDSVLDGLAPLQRVIAAIEPTPSVSVLDIGDRSEVMDNLYVESIDVEAPAVVAGRTTRFTARIRNDTERFGTNVQVTWWINGTQAESQQVSLQPRSMTQARLRHEFTEPGTHSIRVSVEWPDKLLADNERRLAVKVIDSIDVLLVDGQASSEPLQAETDFLAIALSPFALGGSTLPDSVRSQTVNTRGKNAASSVVSALEKFTPDVIVLANVAGASDELRSLIARFVTEGGSVVVFDGALVDPEQYNRSWSYKSTDYLLPGELGEIIELASGEDQAVVAPQINSQFQPWSSVIPAGESTFNDAGLQKYRDLTAGRSRADHAGESEKGEAEQTQREKDVVNVLMQTTTGRPLALSTQWGKGTIAQFAIPCDGEWSSLPLRPVYLPLMQQLVLYLAGQGESVNVRPGETMNVLLSELEPTNAPEQNSGKVDSQREASSERSKARFSIRPPLEKESSIQPIQLAGESEPSRLLFDASAGVGVYEFRRLAEAGTPLESVQATIRVAEIDSSESNLRPAGASRAEALATRVGATLHTDLQTLMSHEQVDRFGREIWRWLLLLLLLALIAEMFLQQRRLIGSKGRSIDGSSRQPTLVKGAAV